MRLDDSKSKFSYLIEQHIKKNHKKYYSIQFILKIIF